jgi:hypothetical protein
MRQARTHTWAPGISPKLKSLQDLSIRVNSWSDRRGCASCWSMSRWMLAFPLAHLQSHPSITRVPIPSVEFFPTNSPKDEGKHFIDYNPLEQVHIIYTSVTKLSLVERLILLHLLGDMNGNIIAVHGHRNVIVCRIVDRPPALVRWRHDGRRPCRVLWSIAEAWARASARWARQERLLHSTYQFLHLAQCNTLIFIKE